MFEPYERRRFAIEAVFITRENITKLAEHLNTVAMIDHGKREGLMHIRIPVISNGRMVRETDIFVGEWVTVNKDGYYQKYSDQKFMAMFKKIDLDDVAKKRRLVREQVAKAMKKQDVSTYHEDPKFVKGVLDEVTDEILKAFLT